MLDISEIRQIEFDVLVIGGGGAGLCAAITAAKETEKVGLICKSLLWKDHTVILYLTIMMWSPAAGGDRLLAVL